MDADLALGTLNSERDRGLALIAAAGTPQELEQAEIAVLGRKAPISEVQRSLGQLGPEDRPRVGKAVNDAFAAIRAAVSERAATLDAAAEGAIGETDRIDVTLPGRTPSPGSLHVLTQTERRIVDVFVSLGYRMMEAPELDTDWYTFESLNIPPDHPARTMQDTIYASIPGHDDLVMRTQTSNQQVRTMEATDPPIYVVSPGRCYRRDTPDATHSPVFHQVEILAVDEGLSLADMKGTLEEFAKAMFGPAQRVRLRPSYFPFVEPGAEVDVSCFVCGGTGCRVCGNGWIEIMGAGMVHPTVLENGGVDPERYTGFAAGLGIERVAMLRHAISDIRLFLENDVRFLAQFMAEPA
ncbi:MAG TPA: phenylalanine--tRNA ligase subunit alpha [Actinomycetota bacterium]|jgi:phenylalanyl-tRNA synthetase alpha chain|nr:phenylalanine--tRNA ligase subunit alpha [Actinomycetota bacterium]